MLFLNIKCVQKHGNLVTDILEDIAPTSSDGVPTEKLLKAENKPGVIEFMKDSKRVFIEYITMNDTKCFFVRDEEKIGKNILEDFDVCDNS